MNWRMREGSVPEQVATYLPASSDRIPRPDSMNLLEGPASCFSRSCPSSARRHRDLGEEGVQRREDALRRRDERAGEGAAERARLERLAAEVDSFPSRKASPTAVSTFFSSSSKRASSSSSSRAFSCVSDSRRAPYRFDHVLGAGELAREPLDGPRLADHPEEAVLQLLLVALLDPGRRRAVVPRPEEPEVHGDGRVVVRVLDPLVREAGGRPRRTPPRGRSSPCGGGAPAWPAAP